MLEPSDCWAASLLHGLATAPALLRGHGSALLHGLPTAYYDQGVSADPSSATGDVRGLERNGAGG